jgi:SAM-dependent methyltransferase
MPDALDDMAGAMAPISLEDLEAGAALRRRVDTKYVVTREALADVLGRAADDYRVLEIDRRRAFTYESVYFDTPDLRSFAEHVDDVRPRFKSRSRLYRETGHCVFEVKVKDDTDTTRKRQCPYDRADHGRVTGEAWRFLDEALRELAGHGAPRDLAATLATRYRRVTMAAPEGGERVTIDLDVAMETMGDRDVVLREDMALIETKTSGDPGVVDELLASMGCEPTSISKYRLGIGLLVAPDPQAARLERLRRCFVARLD